MHSSVEVQLSITVYVLAYGASIVFAVLAVVAMAARDVEEKRTMMLIRALVLSLLPQPWDP